MSKDFLKFKETEIFKCQKLIWETRYQLQSFATLFDAIDGDRLHAESLVGFGFTLQKLAGDLELIEDCLKNHINE